MIEGVKIIPLKRIPDERGCVMHMLKCTDEHFEKFGEIYFSWIYPGVIKGWHRHKIMALNYVCVVGQIKLVLYDGTGDLDSQGNIQEVFIGENNYCLVHVPPFVWNAFTVCGGAPALVANCATEPHDSSGTQRIPPIDSMNYARQMIPYDWGVKNQ